MPVKNRGEGNDFKTTYTISCDTQFPSYLRTRQRGISIPGPGRDEAITECLRFLTPYRSGVDMGPYFYENQDRLDSSQVEETARAFHEFLSAEEGLLATEGRIVSTLSKSDLDKKVTGMMGAFKTDDWKVLAGSAKWNWAVAYTVLLLASAAHIKHRSKSSDYRLVCLLEGLDEVGGFPKIEMHLVHRFFERGNQERFFRGVHQNAGELIGKLKNMAWDLSHKRNFLNQTSALSLAVKHHADFVVPYMLSFDAPLTDLLRDYQINGLVNHWNNQPKFVEIYPLEVEAATSAGFSRVPHLFEEERKKARLLRGAKFRDDPAHRTKVITWAEDILRNAVSP